MAWILFKGAVQRWNAFLRYLQGQVLDEEKQLVPSDVAQEFPSLFPHAPFQSYDEVTFPYNLPKGKPYVRTLNDEADAWLSDFAQLHIDASNMIVHDQTLPDAKFLQKRYLSILKSAHPDRGGTNAEATRVNLAKESLDRLYADPHDQVTLFQAVFTHSAKQPTVQVSSRSPTVVGRTAPYVVLYLVGAGFGLVIVLMKKK